VAAGNEHHLRLSVFFDEASTNKYINNAKARIQELAKTLGPGVPEAAESATERARISHGLSQIPELQQLRAIASVRATADAARQRLLTSGAAADFKGNKTLGLPKGEAGFNELLGRGLAAERRRYAAVDRIATEQLIASDEYISTLARTRQAEKRRSVRVEAEALGIEHTRGVPTSRLQEQILVQKTGQRIRALESQLQADNQLVPLKAQEAVLQRRVNTLKNQEARAIVQEQIRQDPSLRGSAFQRLQAGIATRSGSPPRVPTDYLNLRQFITSRALTTAGFAISGAAIYGVVRGISESVKQAEELQRIFNQIEQQFESLGKAEEFGGFRKQIFAIARETGVAASEVANVGFQFQGAFGGDTQRALKETESAMKAVQVTGLEIREVIDAFTAITQSFKDQGVSIDDLTDKALGLQERFGVLAKETISFAADLAPVAASMGFTAQQLEALGAVANKYSGRSGSSLAEAFGRVLPQIAENAPRLLELFSRVPQLQDDIGAATQAFATGDIESFFTILQNNFAGLDTSTKNFIADMLGGRRETAAIIATLEHGAEVTKEYANINQDAGKSAEYFNRLQKTLAQTLARLREQLKQVGVALFEAGLGQFLTDLGQIAGGVARVLALLVGAFTDVNRSTHGLAGRILEIYLAMKLLTSLGLLAGFGKAVGGRVLGRVAAVGAAEQLALPLEGAALGSAARFGPAAASAAYNAAPAVSRTVRVAGQLGPAGGAAGTGFLTRSGAGLVGFLGGPSVVIPGSILATGYVAHEQRGKVQTEARKLAERIRTYDRARVQQIASQRKGVWDAVGNLLSGTSIQEIGKNELLRRDFAESSTPDKAKALARAGLGLTTTPSRRVIEELRRQGYGVGDLPKGLRPKDVANSKGQIESGYRIGATDIGRLQKDADDTASSTAKASRDALDAIVAQFESTSIGRGALKNALTEGERSAANARNKALADKGQIVADASNAKELYDAGIITIGEYISTLENARTLLRGLGPNYARQLAEIDRQINQFEDEKHRQIVDTAQAFREVAGTDTPQQRLADLRALLPTLRDPKQRAEVAKQIVDATKDTLQYEIENATDTEAALRLLRNGLPIDQATRDEQNVQILTDFSYEWSQFLDTTGSAALGSANLAQRIVAEMNATKTTASAALQALIAAEIAKIDALMNNISDEASTPADDRRLALLGQKRRDLEVAAGEASSLPALPAAPSTTKVEDLAARRQAADLVRNRTLANIALAKARAGGDPVADAALAIQAANASAAYARGIGGPEGEVAGIQAQAELADALRQQAEAFRDVAVAELELVAARTGSPVDDARAAVAAANAQLANARGDAAILRAQAGQVRANRDLADAIFDIRKAEIELLLAYSDAAGTTVESARLAATQAAEELNQIQQTRPGDRAGILRAQANAVRANAQVRDADLAQKKEDIQFALDMEQVTTQQAISQFEALLQIPNLTQEQTRDILRTIKQLRDQLSQDLQFNLPTDLKLPTLYEARRLNQSSGGYQDNRQVAVTMYINNGMDQRQAEQMLNNALGTNRYGFANRRY
jgi:TP901 family phage tail tape measure protein